MSGALCCEWMLCGVVCPRMVWRGTNWRGIASPCVGPLGPVHLLKPWAGETYLLREDGGARVSMRMGT